MAPSMQDGVCMLMRHAKQPPEHAGNKEIIMKPELFMALQENEAEATAPCGCHLEIGDDGCPRFYMCHAHSRAVPARRRTSETQTALDKAAAAFRAQDIGGFVEPDTSPCPRDENCFACPDKVTCCRPQAALVQDIDAFLGEKP